MMQQNTKVLKWQYQVKKYFGLLSRFFSRRRMGSKCWFSNIYLWTLFNFSERYVRPRIVKFVQQRRLIEKYLLVFKYSRIEKFSSIQVFKYSSVQVFKYSSIQIFKSFQVFKYLRPNVTAGLSRRATGPDPEHPDGGLQSRATGGLQDGNCPCSEVTFLSHNYNNVLLVKFLWVVVEIFMTSSKLKLPKSPGWCWNQTASRFRKRFVWKPRSTLGR